MADLDPAALGRMHALQRMAEQATLLADQRPDQPGLNDDDRAYLRAYAETCRGIADRLRNSPGAK